LAAHCNEVFMHRAHQRRHQQGAEGAAKFFAQELALLLADAAAVPGPLATCLHCTSCVDVIVITWSRPPKMPRGVLISA
jgi:hypothetical protein